MLSELLFHLWCLPSSRKFLPCKDDCQQLQAHIILTNSNPERSSPLHLYTFLWRNSGLAWVLCSSFRPSTVTEDDVPCLASLESHPYPSRVEYTLWLIALLEISGMGEGHSPVEKWYQADENRCFFTFHPLVNKHTHLNLYTHTYFLFFNT